MLPRPGVSEKCPPLDYTIHPAHQPCYSEAIKHFLTEAEAALHAGWNKKRWQDEAKVASCKRAVNAYDEVTEAVMRETWGSDEQENGTA